MRDVIKRNLERKCTNILSRFMSLTEEEQLRMVLRLEEGVINLTKSKLTDAYKTIKLLGYSAIIIGYASILYIKHSADKDKLKSASKMLDELTDASSMQDPEMVGKISELQEEIKFTLDVIERDGNKAITASIAALVVMGTIGIVKLLAGDTNVNVAKKELNKQIKLIRKEARQL